MLASVHRRERSAIGALRPVADDTGYGRRCPAADLFVGVTDSLEAAIRGSAGVSQSAASDQIAKLDLQEIEIGQLGDAPSSQGGPASLFVAVIAR
jgi:hypothetical protein